MRAGARIGRRWAGAATASVLLAGCAGEIDELRPVPPDDWQITRGHVDGGGSVNQPELRAVVPASDGNAAELSFLDEGPADDPGQLASGTMRRQIGLKLRAQDGCNLLYVMWRLEPPAQLVVSVKRNPGQRTHLECHANGYRNLGTPVDLGALGSGGSHLLRAIITGRVLRVWTDGALAWQGDLDDDALVPDGPAGVRSDNERYQLELRVRPTARRAPPSPDSDDE